MNPADTAPPGEVDLEVDHEVNHEVDHDELEIFDDAVAPVDPRMRDRWVAQRRAEGRRRLRILVGIAAFASVAIIAFVVAHSSLLGVDTITVHGNARVSAEQVRAAAAIAPGAPLLFLDTGAVARRIEKIPGVARAHVRTDLPSTVVVDVTERSPIAWAHAAGANPVALVAADGLVIERVATPPPGLLRVGGVAAGAVGSHVARLDALRAIGRLPVALRLMTDHYGVSAKGPVLVLGGAAPAAGSVVLGDATQIERKGKVALAVLADLSARHVHKRVVDVTVPDAPVTR
jgi:cell division protein FtsQ